MASSRSLKSKTRELPARAWRLDDVAGCWRIDGADCYVWMQARPHYCDRGRWLAHVEPQNGVSFRVDFTVDSADNWPRYYFDLERAKAEIEAWLLVRKQVI